MVIEGLFMNSIGGGGSTNEFDPGPLLVPFCPCCEFCDNGKLNDGGTNCLLILRLYSYMHLI